MKLQLAAALLLSAVSPAAASPVAAQNFMFETGSTLLAKCRNKAPEYALACTAYIVGAVDGIKKDVFIGPTRCKLKKCERSSLPISNAILTNATRPLRFWSAWP